MEAAEVLFPQKPLWPRLKLPVYVLVLGDKEFNSIIAIKKETNNFVLVVLLVLLLFIGS